VIDASQIDYITYLKAANQLAISEKDFLPKRRPNYDKKSVNFKLFYNP
jgi:hypothetical protein